MTAGFSDVLEIGFERRYDLFDLRLVFPPPVVPRRLRVEVEERIGHVPLGVIANISAWNYPYFVGGNVFVPALAAGNAVLYKPSEFATLTGQHIADLLAQEHPAGDQNGTDGE